ncbi:MAG: phosphatidylglycerophosphate synthase [Cognaticolwellia sp.]|jgi:phosphatidylglycerophosphate synthase
MPSPSRSLVLAAIASALGGALVSASLVGLLNQASSAQAALAAVGGALIPAGALALSWGARQSIGTTVGPANGVTFARGSLGAAAGGVGLVGFVMPLSWGVLWAVVAIAVLALCLDGLDGWVARRFDCASPFGARLDMEMDGLFTLALCVLAWSSGAAGAWILLSGALRGLFILASRVWPWMDRPLFPSQRRRVVCVVQIATLIAACSPPFASISAWVAGAGLATLIYSFGVDTLWLHTHRERP